MLQLSIRVTATLIVVGFILSVSVVAKHTAEWMWVHAPALLLGFLAVALITGLLLLRSERR